MLRNLLIIPICVEAVLVRGRSSRVHFDRWWLQGKRLGLGKATPLRCELRAPVTCFTIFGVAESVVYIRWEAWRHGRLETGGVRCRLGLQLGEVEVATCFVADIHGFMEAALGVVAVEDDGVDGNGDDFDKDLDESADQGPMLQEDQSLALNNGEDGTVNLPACGIRG